MTNKEAIEQLENLKSHCEDFRDEHGGDVWAADIEAVDMAIYSLRETDWIPFLFDKDGYFCCETPYENDEILVSSLDSVWQDTWICTCDAHGNPIEGLESNTYLVGLAWKPMPKPWGGNKE